MTFLLRILLITFLTATTAIAASTKFVSTWKNPSVGLVDLDGKKFAAFIVSADDTMRLGRRNAQNRRRHGRPREYVFRRQTANH